MLKADHEAWLVYTQASHDAALEHSPDYRACHEAKAPRFASDTESLLQLTSIDSAGWENTLLELHRCTESNQPDRFGRVFDHGATLSGPVYAIRVTGALFHTQGGLCVNDEARVLAQDGTPFPNLFAGGGSARSVSGPADRGYLPAMGLCTAVTYGRLAGQHAAHQILASQSSGLT
jgi:fumarate reductase flavoprotein subunit